MSKYRVNLKISRLSTRFNKWEAQRKSWWGWQTVDEFSSFVYGFVGAKEKAQEIVDFMNSEETRKGEGR